MIDEEIQDIFNNIDRLLEEELKHYNTEYYHEVNRIDRPDGSFISIDIYFPRYCKKFNYNYNTEKRSYLMTGVDLTRFIPKDIKRKVINFKKELVKCMLEEIFIDDRFCNNALNVFLKDDLYLHQTEIYNIKKSLELILIDPQEALTVLNQFGYYEFRIGKKFFYHGHRNTEIIDSFNDYVYALFEDNNKLNNKRELEKIYNGCVNTVMLNIRLLLSLSDEVVDALELQLRY